MHKFFLSLPDLGRGGSIPLCALWLKYLLPFYLRIARNKRTKSSEGRKKAFGHTLDFAKRYFSLN
jgi:hypothetical protein